MRVKDCGEFPLIKRLMDVETGGRGIIVPSGDDAAIVEISPGRMVVFTCDCMVENVHFLPASHATDVGFKLMSSCISDIAAMGGVPLYALVTLVVPGDCSVQWVEDLYRGLRLSADQEAIKLVGGDTSSGQSIMVNVSLLGEIEPCGHMLRKLAQPGDLVCVTGPLGGSAAGLEIVLGNVSVDDPSAKEALAAHFRPKSKIKVARQLAAAGCRCANDISDGLG
ncbi:MAG: thiamine-phosphate kinase, partial [bacterium]|nr:thiamine-phosphate kinase [bacterium]